MKAKFKKLMAVALSAVMAITMCVATQVKAAETATTTTLQLTGAGNVSSLTGRTFKAYRLFNVELDGKNYVYTDVDSSVTTAVIGAIRSAHKDYNDKYVVEYNEGLPNEQQIKPMPALPAAEKFKTAADVVSFFADTKTYNAGKNVEFKRIFAKYLQSVESTLKYTDSSSSPAKTNLITLNDKSSFKKDNAPFGYYVIVEDVTKIQDQNYTATAPILHTIAKAGDGNIAIKGDMPKVTKKISDPDVNQPEHPESVDSKKFVDHDDYSIGDTVRFRLKGTVPEETTLDRYDTYKYEFHDTFTNSLAKPAISSFTVRVGNKDLKVDSVTNEIYYETNKTDSEGKTTTVRHNVGKITIGEGTITVAFDDIKIFQENFYKHSESPADPATDPVKEIVVFYESKLTSNAILGSITEDNKNDVYINFSNNPYFKGDGNMGKSEVDTVYVYTTGLKLQKQDGVTEDSLSGAEFELKLNADADDHSDKNLICFTEAIGTDGLKKYKVDIKGTPIKDNGQLTGENTTFKVYDNTVTKDEEKIGLLYIDGLGEGTYYLHETKAPAGYNKLDQPIKIEVKANYTKKGVEGEEFTGFTYTVNGKKYTETAADVDSYRIDFKVANYSGAQLPETGGMGTTLLYVVGIIAMAAGACYFAMDKKRKAQQK